MGNRVKLTMPPSDLAVNSWQSLSLVGLASGVTSPGVAQQCTSCAVFSRHTCRPCQPPCHRDRPILPVHKANTCNLQRTPYCRFPFPRNQRDRRWSTSFEKSKTSRKLSLGGSLNSEQTPSMWVFQVHLSRQTNGLAAMSRYTATPVTSVQVIETYPPPCFNTASLSNHPSITFASLRIAAQRVGPRG